MKGLLGRLALLAAGLLFGLLALEAALRLIGWSAPRIVEHNPDRGKSYRPGVRWHQREEGEADVVINRYGFRDRDWSVAKPPNTVRLAVLGDSFVDALQVPADSTFCRVLERRLAGCRSFGDRRVEVMNFGVSGYGTAQELQTLRHAVWKFDPDIVLLSFLPGNDVRDNGAALQRSPDRPYFTLEGDSLRLDASFRRSHERTPPWIRSAAFALLDHSRVAQAVYRFRMRSRERAQLRTIHERTDVLGSAAHQELGLDNMVYREPTHPAWIDAWRITDALIVEMNREVTAGGARFLVATVSSSIQVHPDEEVQRAFETELGVDSLSYPDARVAALGAANGFAVVRLAPPLAAWARLHHGWLHGFPNTRPGYGHWNSLGHRLAGSLLAESVAERFGESPCPGEITPTPKEPPPHE